MPKLVASQPSNNQRPPRHQDAGPVIEWIRDQMLRLRHRECSEWPRRLKAILPIFKRYRKMQRRLALCQSHALAAVRDNLLEYQLPTLLGDLQRDLTSLDTLLAEERHRSIVVPSMRELYSELEQLAREFGKWEYDRAKGALCVSTDAIELEGVYLGAFEIQLLLDRLDSDNPVPLAVVALNPQSPTRDSAITHPHVHLCRPCLGEATTPAHEALRSGRICDLFLLVRQVLNNYNPESAFVQLENWFGDSCGDCGDDVDDQSRCSCNRCDTTLCSDCTQCCSACDDSFCRSCIGNCSHCDKQVCASCRQDCWKCKAPGCLCCLNDGLCAKCIQAKENQDENPTSAAA